MRPTQLFKRIGTVFLTIGFLGLNASGAHAQTGTTATGGSNTLNPAISLNTLFLARWQDPKTDLDGLKAQEVELAMMAIVDPYFKARAFVAYEPDPASAEAEVALEEVYVQTMALPQGWGLRAGRMFYPFGRHNQLHTHQFPFVVAPLAVAGILGEESAGDVGLDLSYAPLMPWYLNLRLFGGDGASHIFDGESRELAFASRVENLWDLGEATTFEWAASFINGPDSTGSRRTFLGSDVRLKWKDPRRTYGHVLVWQTEILLDRPAEGPDRVGVYTLAQYRMSRRWWIEGGYSWLSQDLEETGTRESAHEIRGQLAFVPSAFSALRAELTWRDPIVGERELAALLQLNFTIGSHPAHRY